MDRQATIILRARFAKQLLLAVATFIAIGTQTCATRKYTAYNDFGTPKSSEIFEIPTRVTIGNESNFSPTLSPNGAYMFYTSDRNGNKDIFVKKTRGGYATPITNHPADDFSPVMSPNGKYLAFVSRRTNAAGAIHIMELGAGISNLGGLVEPTLVDINLRELESRNPAWFPSGKKIAFSAREMGAAEPKLYIADIDNEPTISALGDIHGDYPTVSADGKKIAFSRGGFIYVYDLDQHTETQLTDGSNGKDGHPNFLADNNTIIFIRYADDTNNDGLLTPEDRPSIWSLDLSFQLKSTPTSRESFYLRPITSASRPAYYPRHFPPYIYFASEESDSLDIYRLPETGHTKSHTNVAETVLNFEQTIDDEDKIYVLRRDSSMAAARGDRALVAQIALRELDWLRELGRKTQAINLRQKIARELSDQSSVQALADILMISMEIAPYRYPDQSEQTPDNLMEICHQWRKSLNNLGINSSNKNTYDESVQANTEFVQAEIDATIGRISEAVARLRKLPDKYRSQPTVGAKALSYLSKLEASQGHLKEATAAVLLLGRYFPSEVTILNSSAIDLTLSIDDKDNNAIENLSYIVDESKDIGILRVQARKRLGDVLRTSRKYEAARSEYRTILKERGGTAHAYLQTAKELVQREESEGRFSVVLAIFTDLREALKLARDEDQRSASEMEADFHVRRGRALLNSNEMLLAQKEFEMAIDVSPTNISAREGIIDIAEARETLNATIEAYRKSVAQSPRDPDRMYLLAYAIQKNKAKSNSQRSADLSESISLLENARQINGQTLQFHKLLGKLYLEKSHLIKSRRRDTSFAGRVFKTWDNAKSFFGFPEPNWTELSIDSSLTAHFLSGDDSIERADLSMQLGNTYFENQTFTLSLRHYMRRISALANQPIQDTREELKLFRHAGRSAFFADELELASTLQRKSLQLATKLDSKIDQAYALDALALTLREEKKYKDAKIIYSRLLDVQSKLDNKLNLVGTRINLAYCYMMDGNHEAALEEYRKAEDLLSETKTEESLKMSEGIMIDIAGENSAARGFTKLDNQIQIAAFRAQIYENMGNFSVSMEHLKKKIALLMEKRKKGQKFELGDGYLGEELATAHNNAGYIATTIGNLPEGVLNFTAALTFARALRSKNQEFPSRSEWLNLLDLARAQLRRADLMSLPKAEQLNLESQLDAALNQLAKPVLAGNREATLAAAALNSVSAQLLSVDTASDGNRKSLAQARFQDSILLAQKLGMELPFVSSANLNLDRESAADNPAYEDIITSHTEFRRSALTRPGLAWKYLATRELCAQAIEALSSHLATGGRLIENDANLMRTCVDTELTKKGVEDTSKSRILRQYYFIKSQIIISGRQFDRESDLVRQTFELFRLGKSERIGAALEGDEALITIYKTGNGIIYADFTSQKGLEGFIEITPESKNTSSSIESFLDIKLNQKNLRRVYFVTDDSDFSNKIMIWGQMRPQITISFLPTPDFLPNVITSRRMHFGATQKLVSNSNDDFWRGYIEQIAAGHISPIVLIQGDRTLDDSQFRTQLYESPLEEAIKDSFKQTYILGYPGLSLSSVKKNAARFYKRALSEYQKSAQQGDVDLSDLRAKEAFFYAWFTNNNEFLFQAADAAYQSSLLSTKKIDLLYFLNMERHFSAELNKGQSALRDIEAAEVQHRNGNMMEAEQIIQKVLTSKDTKSLKPNHLGKLHEIHGKIYLQKRQLPAASQSFEHAAGHYKTAKEYASAARCEMQKAKILAYEFLDFQSAKAHLAKADSLSLQSDDPRARFDVRMLSARIMIQSHEESQAQDLLLKLIADDSSRLSAMELADIYITIAESFYWQGQIGESERFLNESLKQNSKVKATASAYAFKMRSNNLRAMILAASGKKQESVSLFNSTILQAVENKNLLLERDARHNLAHWHRQWGEYPKAAALFSSSIKINKTLSTADAQLIPFTVTETANLALTLALGGNVAEAKDALDEITEDKSLKNMRYASVFASLVRADILRMEKNYPEALKSLQIAHADADKYKIKNLLWRSQYGLGTVFAQLGQKDDAIKQFKNAYDYVSTLRVGVQRAEFSSDSFSQASADSLIESYVFALVQAGYSDQGAEVALTHEAASNLENMGRITSPGKEGSSYRSYFRSHNNLTVYYFIGKSRSLVFLENNGTIEGRFLDINSIQMENLTNSLTSLDAAKELDARNQLGKALLKPIEEELASAGVFTPISTKEISKIPFGSLQFKGHDLIDRVAVGRRPIQSTSTAISSKTTRSRYMKVLAVILPQDRESFLSKESGILPRFFPDALILSDQNLSREKFYSMFEGKDVLHLSGIYHDHPGEPKRSKVIFARKNQKFGFLDAQDIALSKDSPDLVFLTQPIIDDMLPHAFITAGSNWVIVNTAPRFESDALFVAKNFYNFYQQGMDPCSALRSAQIKTKNFISDARSWPYFSVIGNCHSSNRTAGKAQLQEAYAD